MGLEQSIPAHRRWREQSGGATSSLIAAHHCDVTAPSRYRRYQARCIRGIWPLIMALTVR